MKYAIVIFSFFAALLPSDIWSKVGSDKIYEFTANFTIDRPEQSFDRIRVWIPLAQNTNHQKVLEEELEGKEFTLTHDKKYRNRVAFVELNNKTSFPVHLKLKWKVRRTQATPIQKEKTAQLRPKNFLAMNKLVPINGIIAEEAKKAVSKKPTREKIEQLYLHVVDKLTYDKSGKGWGQGDAIWACSAEKGNCTDFHSLLVGMARSQDIPAQFNIGFPIPPQGEGVVPGYHCWAKLFESRQGWIPMDASESHKTGLPWKYFGKLPPNRIHFTTGRDLVLNPTQASGPLNYFIYPHIELDGEKYSSYKRKYKVRTLSP